MSSAHDVPAVVILPTRGGSFSTTIEALADQTVDVQTVIGVGAAGGAFRSAAAGAPSTVTAPTFAQAVAIGRRASRSLWLLDSGTAPEPQALAALLSAHSELEDGGRAALLASRVINERGTLDPGSLPVIDARRPERVLRALEHHCVALRAARHGSLLVNVEALEQSGAVLGDGAPASELTWTARLLRHRIGMLVPGSVVLRASGEGRADQPSRAALAVEKLRLITELDPKDRVWFLAQLVRELSGHRSSRG